MIEYKGTSQFDIGSGYGILEYDFYFINGELDYKSLINFYCALWQRFDYYVDGYHTTKNNRHLSPYVIEKMNEHNANLCLTFMEEEAKEENILIRKMIVNEKKENDTYDTSSFNFYVFKENNIKKYIGKAYIFSQNGFNNAAIAYYSEAINLEPDMDILYVYRGNLLFDVGNIDGAIEDFNKALKNNFDNAAVYIRRGHAYVIKGEYDKAISDCTHAIKLEPNNDKAYIVRSSAYKEKGLFNEAISDCSKAIEINPNETYNYSARGAVKRDKGDFDGAKDDYKKALEIEPNNKGAKKNLDILTKNGE